MKWVGLTGGIASGKTTVSNILKEFGVPVLDADLIARHAFRSCEQKIKTYFGLGILAADGTIDRKKLGDRVFANKKEKEALEALIHPIVQDKVAEKKRLLEVAGHDLAVYDVPLLFEKQLESTFDHVLVVYIPETLSLQRLMDRNNLTEEQARFRIENQIDIEIKKTKADTVIDNSGDLESLRRQVIAWLESTKESGNQR